MKTASNYKIYNASAGSGKTYALVKDYLKLLLTSENRFTFRSILAITFTNKAVNEMKSRILSCLYQFSSDTILQADNPLFKNLVEETSLSPKTIHEKAKVTLKYILHHYSFFDVTTIDKFTNRIIRTFSRDLQLPQNFEVVLDTDLLLSEAVENLLAKVKTESLTSKTLLDYSMSKIDDDKSWDISFDLNDKGKLIFNENHATQLDLLTEKDLSDFSALKKTLSKKIESLKTAIKTKAHHTLSTIKENSIDSGFFSRKLLPNFLEKATLNPSVLSFTPKWLEDFENKTHYNKNTPEDIKSSIDSLMPLLSESIQSIKTYFYQLTLLENIQKNITPLSILNAIRQEIKLIELERDEIPLAFFNSIIAKDIKDQPAPYIYERLGEKYKHFFIDEFQDTSELQWQNLIPLIGNALEGNEKASLLLVGDAKQAIYRWRGGKVNQFLNLYNKTNQPFFTELQTIRLDKNYRSAKTIVDFNNSFFEFGASFLEHSLYKELYLNHSFQEAVSDEEGYLEINFVSSLPEDKSQPYYTKIFEGISKALDCGFNYSDICILVRKNDQGSKIADYLTTHDIPIISSESLLLKNSPEVIFLIDFLKYSLNKHDEFTKLQLLSYLNTRKKQDDYFGFVKKNIKNFEAYIENSYGFSMSVFEKLPLYDGLYYIINCFEFNIESDAYISYFIDEVFEFGSRKSEIISEFLAYWDKYQHKLSVSAPEGIDAVKIMTIHKSKGLEFLVVIFPFANDPVISNRKDPLWISVSEDEYNGFSNLLVNSTKTLSEQQQDIKTIYLNEQNALALDSFNILYVALTRAEKQLYIISDLSKVNSKSLSWPGLFKGYLASKNLWNEALSSYSFGTLLNYDLKNEALTNPPVPFYNGYKNKYKMKIVTKSGSLWDTKQSKAIEKGLLVHHLLSKINTVDNIDNAIIQLQIEGQIKSSEISFFKETLSSLLNQKELKPYYSKDCVSYNEREVMTKSGELLRPDRVVIKNNLATIIDYKTGKEQAKHKQQLAIYAKAIEEMGIEVEHKILVYLNETSNIVFC